MLQARFDLAQAEAREVHVVRTDGQAACLFAQSLLQLAQEGTGRMDAEGGIAALRGALLQLLRQFVRMPERLSA